ncbi:MAG: flagellar biosynthesis anti-sigma factor FlgM [Selenomonadaceae bacterium]|nr:flagellar biosynthesis anti-sigma factor FlgM [Selenomonadaceae bacterium]
MIINNNVNSLLYTSNAVSSTKKSNNAIKAKNANSFQDEMRLSKEALTFNDMLKKLQKESDVRQDKVEEYSRKIETGSYDIASENIAASILMNNF